MLVIDGSMGEGGGQVLRTCLALALCRGEAFRIEHVRSRRARPGLLAQHLAAVRAAARVGSARVRGDTLGSDELVFEPEAARPGRYEFQIGTAGSTTLVLQTVLPALLVAAGPSDVSIEGGTHNPLAPPFEFLAQAFLPLLERMGPRVHARLVRPGFYPAGGGLLQVSATPARLHPLHLRERGAIRSLRARALLSRLPRHIAERELEVLGRELDIPGESLHVQPVLDARGPGNAVIVEVQCEHVTEVFAGIGIRGVSAEVVAQALVDEVRRYLVADVAVGEHLADQLLVPLALAGGGSFVTLRPSSHATTNAEVIRKFLDVEIELVELGADRWEVRLERRER
ncbi:MAG: RNA 3'-terminal phosphate cyclase [Gammaproteobacteria bacterium]|nr:RNA 3'-terminal phosphate cyclase [Gammaproteobacteria bacterium]NIR99078.1 RNA 3'-terminal phosphate cyclase [Gammaproteobacteria bacterium]NIT64710.1 RNA 3'-terminal phosphate cyclase [Gammaproteobacteria bacterium]NIV21668.1 RNA 3'-terminal phosphate cyclase [Gammaproteobacteria bacterium]NIX10630.1 RNA 3'-terminal phosphate cyclase [Gammaproteobacteria bacterium]